MTYLKHCLKIFLILLGILGFRPLLADTFVVQNINVIGLQHFTQATVLHYLPIKPGQEFSDQQSAAILQALYKTGFFSDVRLSRSNGTLLVYVKERAAIGTVQLSGNKAISSKKLQEALKRMGVVEGQILDSYKLQQIAQGLKQQYDLLGMQDAIITTDMVPENGNRVGVVIHINEGAILKVGKIHIVGNTAFGERILLKNFHLTRPGLLTFLTHTDRYSKEQLEEDLDNLHNFYLDHGYWQFHVISRDVSVAPGGQLANIVITVYEGPIYRISGAEVHGLYADQPGVLKIVSALHPGVPFSRQQLMDVNQSIQDYLADRGYAFAEVNVAQHPDEANHTVYLILNIVPGHHIYVHEVNFIGNYHTQDLALRGEIQQLEGSVFSLRRVNESKRQLANLAYLKDIQVVTVPVPERPDQVDLNYHVTEVNAGRAGVQGGYGTTDGVLFGASVSEPNFMGTGKFVSLSFNRSNVNTEYMFSYNNPFYTLGGISRGFQLYYTTTRRTRQLNFDPYNMQDFGGNVNYGIPVTDFDNLSLGYGYDHITISNVIGIVPTPLNAPFITPAPPDVLAFLNTHTNPFHQFNLLGGLSHSTLDQAVFPTSGGAQDLNLTVGVPILGSNRRFTPYGVVNAQESVGYYKAVYSGTWYWPLGHGFIISPHTTLGYGRGYANGSALPFFDDFYAGGIETLPGFQPNSLGPKNPNYGPNPEQWTALGGNVEILGGLNFIFPNFISDRIRTAAILDAGNIFQTNRAQYNAAQLALNPNLRPMLYENISLRNLRVSTGLMVSWMSPLGLIDFSLATPLVHKKGFDQLAIFGFTFGTSI